MFEATNFLGTVHMLFAFIGVLIQTMLTAGILFGIIFIMCLVGYFSIKFWSVPFIWLEKRYWPGGFKWLDNFICKKLSLEDEKS